MDRTVQPQFAGRRLRAGNWTTLSQYTFPAGTMLNPGEYLVLARDSAALKAKYPQLAGQIWVIMAAT